MYRNLSCFARLVNHVSVLVVVGTVTLALAVVSDAHAAPDQRSLCVIVHQADISWDRPTRRSAIPGTDHAWFEYERGLAAGNDEGFNAGYHDGFFDRRFYDIPASSFCNHTAQFERGYREAFSCKYAKGFERGHCERPCARSRWECRR